MEAAVEGRPVRDIGRAVEQAALAEGFAVARELTGHGVGRKIHEAPSVPNYDDPYARTILRDGMVLAVEPILTEHPTTTVEESDGWTIRTGDRGLSTHYENTIVVRGRRPLILTAA
jgi:methionyl aminopeptidase